MALRLIACLLLCAAPAQADVWSFASPSGNIECWVGENFGGSDIECTIFARSAPMPQYPNCPVGRGITVFMQNVGNVTVSCTPAGSRATGAQHVADYGLRGNSAASPASPPPPACNAAMNPAMASTCPVGTKASSDHA